MTDWLSTSMPYTDGSNSKESTCNAGGPRFDPGVGKIPWRRKWQPAPVLLPGELHGQRILVGCSPWGHKDSDTTEWLTLSLLYTARNLANWFCFSTHQRKQLLLISCLQNQRTVCLLSVTPQPSGTWHFSTREGISTAPWFSKAVFPNLACSLA